MQWFTRLSALQKAALTLVVLTFLTYAPSLGNDFQAYDDTLLITKNLTAHGVSITNLYKAFTTFDPELYIPLTLITYQIEYSLFGLTPLIYHLTNLLLHIGSAIFLLLTVFTVASSRTKRALRIAFITAAIFALHPLNTEAVAWTAARKDVLSGFFFFASLWAYVRSQQKMSIGFFALGLLSKVSIVVLPVLLVLVDLFRGKNVKEYKQYIPYGVLSALFILIAIFGKQQQMSVLTPLQHVLLWCKSVAFSFQKIFVPHALSITYSQQNPVTIASAEFALPLLFVLALIIAACVAMRRKPLISLCIMWYLVCMSPSIMTFWKNGFLYYASDRYSYIAMTSITLAVAIVIAQRRYLVGILCVVLMWMSWQQSMLWRNSLTLYGHAIAHSSRPVLELYNLGTYHYIIGNEDKALELYHQSLEYDQHFVDPLINIGKIHRLRGDMDEAAIWFERSIRAMPTNREITSNMLQAYFLLGEYYDTRNNAEKALSLFEQATAKAPLSAEAHTNLGIMYHKYARVQDAVASFLNAIEADPDFYDARYRLSALLAESGDISGAIENLEYIVQRKPQYEQAQRHLEALRRFQ